MEIPTATQSAPSSALGGKGGFAAVSSEDFLNLMIKELQNQDPLDPTSNEQLMQQLATIRDMEFSATLTESIRTLTDQQRFGTASALIGQYVRGPEPESGELPIEGVVRSLRFTDGGKVVLELVGGQKLPLQDLAEVSGLETLIGQLVEFVRTGENGATEQSVGEIIGVSIGESGEPVLEVDTGGLAPIPVRLREVVSLSGGLELVADESGAPSVT